MTNPELEQLLRSVKAPERPPGYRAEFAKSVMVEIRRRTVAPALLPDAALQDGRAPLRESFNWLATLRRNPAFALGLFALCLIGLAAGLLQQGRASTSEEEIAAKYLKEVEALFPKQVAGIIFDKGVPQLVLSEKTDVPVSPPVYLKVCDTLGCQRFVTFSGSRISLHGETLDVLLDRNGNVLLVGERWIWSSSNPSQKGRFHIEGRQLRLT